MLAYFSEALYFILHIIKIHSTMMNFTNIIIFHFCLDASIIFYNCKNNHAFVVLIPIKIFTYQLRFQMHQTSKTLVCSKREGAEAFQLARPWCLMLGYSKHLPLQYLMKNQVKSLSSLRCLSEKNTR